LLLKSSLSGDKYIRAIIHLGEGVDVYFSDMRKFGGMWLVGDRNVITDKLGPEPLEVEFTPEVLATRLHNRTAPIKALLCDQSFIAGIGNMYADETLFAAGIHPLRLGGSLSWGEVEQLYHTIRQVLLAAIGDKGASVMNYYRPGGEVGTAHFQFKVAHRGGKPCPNCGISIQRIPIRNRGSYFCAKCQV
jgi:formamidopyrimidine-DNA glycosylase